MKLIDETVNPAAVVKGRPGFLSVTIFANSKGAMTIPTKVGTILRIHRGDVKKYGKEFQLNCDVNIKGAWVMFDPFEGFSKIAESGRTHTFINDDKTEIKEIRKFSKGFFKSYDISEASTVGEKKDEFDMLCLVLDRKPKGKVDIIRVCDGKEIHKLEVPSGKYPHVAPQDAVHVRAIKEKAGKFTVNDYSNMLKVAKDFGAAIELQKTIDKETKKDTELGQALKVYTHKAEVVVMGSEVLGENITKVSSLKELYSMDLSKSKTNKFKVHVSVIEIGPKDTSSWIQAVDAKAKKQ